MSFTYTNKDNQFYPTPGTMVDRMINMIDFGRVCSILEPSAGKGNIIDRLKENYSCKKTDWRYTDCIEIDSNLRAILKGKGYNVIGEDFLNFNTYSQYDLIIMNPPFADGDKHLLKALEIQRNGGQICCILNAETLRNPCTVYRQELLNKLDEYEAKVKYVDNGFSRAERRTDVETAIVYVDIPKKQYDYDILSKLTTAEDFEDVYNDLNTQLVTNDVIDTILRHYNDECRLGVEVITQFERLASIMPKSSRDSEIITMEVRTSETDGTKSKQNAFIRELRYKYWTTLFQTGEFSKLMTKEVRDNLYKDMNRFRSFDFTLSNIKALQIELSANLTNNIEDAILKQFEELTYKHSTSCAKNVHYFNGWVTNDAYMINKKVIIPCYDVYDRWGYWNIHRLRDNLDELEKIFTYLDGGKTEGDDLQTIINRYYNSYAKDYKKWYGEDIDFKYFRIEAKKKGTLHVYFKDLELLKKFNIFGARKKGWLPDSYGKKKYKDMTKSEQEVVDSFEGERAYSKIINNPAYYMNVSTINMLGMN